MSKLAIEAEKRLYRVALPMQGSIELEWAGVLDCGALGPSRSEPELFHQSKNVSFSARSVPAAVNFQQESSHV